MPPHKERLFIIHILQFIYFYGINVVCSVHLVFPTPGRFQVTTQGLDTTPAARPRTRWRPLLYVAVVVLAANGFACSMIASERSRYPLALTSTFGVIASFVITVGVIFLLSDLLFEAASNRPFSAVPLVAAIIGTVPGTAWAHQLHWVSFVLLSHPISTGLTSCEIWMLSGELAFLAAAVFIAAMNGLGGMLSDGYAIAWPYLFKRD